MVFEYLKKNIRQILLYVFLFAFILATGKYSNGFDYDLWIRLIVGMAFCQKGLILKEDFLSYAPTHTWFDHEWGSGVVFYLVQHLFSTAGISVLQAVLIFLMFFLLYY